MTITRTAFAIKDGQDRVGVISGRSLSVRSVLMLAVMLIAVRIALAAYANWQSANISTRVVAGLRQRLAVPFSSRPGKYSRPSGRGACRNS